MKYDINVSSLSKNQLMAINGGEGRYFMPYGAPLFFLLKSIYEIEKDAAEFQASLPPN